jgi:hypothetical protein
MKFKDNKLFKSIILDLIGMASMFIPVVGWALDLIWAPYAAGQMRKMYPTIAGKRASWIVFIEEILPWTDFIPTFSAMWVYEYCQEKVSLKKLEA